MKNLKYSILGLCLLLCCSCAQTRRLERSGTQAVLSLVTRQAEKPKEVYRPNWTKVKNPLTQDSLYFGEGIIDSTGQRHMLVRLEPIEVVARRKTVIERLGRVMIGFRVEVPEELQSRSFGIRLTPVLHKRDTSFALDALLIRGGLYAGVQSREAWQFDKYRRIVAATGEGFRRADREGPQAACTHPAAGGFPARFRRAQPSPRGVFLFAGGSRHGQRRGVARHLAGRGAGPRREPLPPACLRHDALCRLVDALLRRTRRSVFSHASSGSMPRSVTAPRWVSLRAARRSSTRWGTMPAASRISSRRWRASCGTTSIMWIPLRSRLPGRRRGSMRETNAWPGCGPRPSKPSCGIASGGHRHARRAAVGGRRLERAARGDSAGGQPAAQGGDAEDDCRRPGRSRCVGEEHPQRISAGVCPHPAQALPAA
ncbi:MAG: hypothetical protein ACLR8Y_16420 [Alistipes indistinctus]